jgi:hypothetical protein
LQPSTFDALVILVVAFAPGAAYVWAFERQAGPYGVTLADRMMRFLAASIVVHLAFGWLEYLAWRVALHRLGRLDAAQFAVLWGAAVTVIGGPTAIGWALGSLYASRAARTTRHTRLRGILGLARERGADRESALLAAALGRAPAPRAWDHVFGSSPSALIRMQLHNDVWIGGLFGDASYASSYPETSGDLYLERSMQIDDDGTFVQDDEANLVDTGGGILVRWEEVRFLNVFDYVEEADGAA